MITICQKLGAQPPKLTRNFTKRASEPHSPPDLPPLIKTNFSLTSIVCASFRSNSGLDGATKHDGIIWLYKNSWNAAGPSVLPSQIEIIIINHISVCLPVHFWLNKGSIPVHTHYWYHQYFLLFYSIFIYHLQKLYIDNMLITGFSHFSEEEIQGHFLRTFQDVYL